MNFSILNRSTSRVKDTRHATLNSEILGLTCIQLFESLLSQFPSTFGVDSQGTRRMENVINTIMAPFLHVQKAITRFPYQDDIAIEQ